MPILDFAFLADAAEAEPGRKLYVLGGGIDQIAGPQYPLVHPHMSLVMRWLLSLAEMNSRHHLEIRLVDADGAELAKIEGDIEAGGMPPAGQTASVNMVINMANTRFDRPGDYAFEIQMNHQHAKSVPLRVATVPI